MITDFRGEYAFLSNFWRERDGLTLEHRFQAAKCTTEVDRDAILGARTPGDAKRLGRRVALRADWEEVKDQVMFEMLEAKFKDPQLRAKLLATGDTVLVEGNTWGDRYWGVDSRTGQGQNVLGKLLMRLRLQLPSY